MLKITNAMTTIKYLFELWYILLDSGFVQKFGVQ